MGSETLPEVERDTAEMEPEVIDSDEVPHAPLAWVAVIMTKMLIRLMHTQQNQHLSPSEFPLIVMDLQLWEIEVAILL
eukprot:6306528-Amphidinium_carterae.1